MMNSWCLPLAALVGVFFVLSSATDDLDCREFYQPNNSPQITPCKKEIILQNGQNYTLKCRANAPVEFVLQDLPEEKVGNFTITQGNYTDENAEYQFETYLELENVDRYAIGYYACIRKDSLVDRNILKELADEPNNTEFVSYIYIYVNGTDSLYAPMREIVMGKKDFYVVECKPSTPDVDVKISLANKTPNYLKFTPKIGFVMDTCSKIAYKCLANKNGSRPEWKIIRWQKDQPNPTIDKTYKEFLSGETFSLNCTVNYTPNSAQVLEWDLPADINNTVIHYSNKDTVTQGIQYHNITIVNAGKEHEMNYTCIAKNHCGKGKSYFEKKFLEKAKLKISGRGLNKETGTILIQSKQLVISRDISVESYPPAHFSVYKNNMPMKNEGKDLIKVTDNLERGITRVVIRIDKKNVDDSGNYTIFARNGYLNDTVTFDIRLITAPVILSNNTVKYCELNRTVSLQCEITGFPLPTVKWITNTSTSNVMESTKVDAVTVYKEKAFLDVLCTKNIKIICEASNDISTAFQSIDLRVNEVPDGFGIKTMNDEDNIIWFSEEQDATVTCVASIHKFDYVTWYLNDTELDDIVEHTKNQFSLVAKLKIKNISVSNSGTYVCQGLRINGTSETKEIDIQIDQLTSPIVNFSTDISGTVEKFQPIHLFCKAEGVPRPTIKWYKGNKEFIPQDNDTNIEFLNNIVDRKTVNSTIYIKRMNEENRGMFECVATNNRDQVKKSAELILKEVAYTKYVIAIIVIFVVLIAIVVFLVIKLRKDKAKRARLRRELAAAGLLYFNEGQSKSLNPDLGIDEQADLLPYDEKFEFPPEKLILGKQLGAGAFGVVYKAEARGIINAEETTPVAVKMVKRTADNMYIKALATELKIMVHLGKHVNIVNLLGACTKNVGKRELSVIVEYCKFGNIHNYMQRHREVFIDQFSDNNKEKSFGKVNRGYDSSGSTGVQSDYGTANTQDTDHTFLTNNTNRTSRKNVRSQPPELAKASESYIQPEWRSNYVSDYSYDGRSPRPLTSRDLLCWAFQIARGMEYLANRKILHGDLAARNILLAEDNIVKICDFGLARSIYKNDEYQKKENSLLPVKWLAIECMTDRIFSTQSDVWSFGIVLWELFTLAKTPYPNMDPHHLLPFLREGRRLEKPSYSDDRIYSVMKRCWEEKPTMRPSFTQLQEELGTFLEENVRNHYVDLNNAYTELNTRPEGQEDYLAMVSAPDYNNMVTPSPHHYVNEIGDSRRFFPPTPTKIDEDGYLQMTPRSNDIFSPKPTLTATRFDFEPRKLNSRPSEASSAGSELTPMLTINNLARSGSDSDHEGNLYPYPNVCPTINEESVDDVFLTKQSNETSNQNAKNAQNSAVTNPTYITFDLDVEKKPKDVNSYVNIKPNGLVK